MAIQRRLIEAVEVTENRVHVIRLKGIFDASTVSEFEKVVSYLLSRNFYRVIVDLGHVEFISSAGWGAFTAELRRVRENQGDVKLANMSPDVYDVFLLLELDSFIQSFDTVDESLAAFAQPAVAPEPAPTRPSILQEIKAAAYAREMAEAGARAIEKPAADFSERWREHTMAGQVTYGAAYAAPASEKAGFAGAPRDKDGAGERFEYAAGRSASRDEQKATAPNEGESFGGQFEYASGSGAAEVEYGDSSHLPHGQYGTAVQTEYAGEAERVNFSIESHDESAAARQAAYPGDENTDESEHENSSVGADDESGATEQVEYAGGVYADEDGSEDSSAEFNGEDGATAPAEYTGDVYADESDYEASSVEFTGEDDATAPTEYTGDVYADEGEYKDSSAEFNGEDDATAPAEYAGDVYADEGEYEASSAELDGEDDATAPAEYAGDVYADEGEYEASSAELDGEDDAMSPAEYAGDVYADEGEYEASSAELDGEDDATAPAEYTGDVYADEGEYEASSAELDGADDATAPAEYAGDVYADEDGYEDSSAELDGADGATAPGEYAGDVYADEGEYEDSSVESDGEYVAADEAEYAGDGYASEDEYESFPVESEHEDSAAELADCDVETQNDYTIAGADGEGGSTRSISPAPSGPEMWELILAGGQAPVDPFVFEKSAPTIPAEKRPQEFFDSAATQPFSARPNEDSLPNSESEVSTHDTGSAADSALEEFVELGAEPDWGFAGHEPFVDDSNGIEAYSASASAEADFVHDPSKSSHDGGDRDEFDELGTQDIRDPWILDEIDTLPEEYEMEGGAADGAEPSFSASELLSYDLELDTSFSPLPNQAYERSEIEAAGDSSTRFGALSQTVVDDSSETVSDLSTLGAEEELQFAAGFTQQAAEDAMPTHDDLPGNFSTPGVTDENLTMAEDDSFASPALDEEEELIGHASALPALSSPNGNGEASHGYPPEGALPKIPASDNLEEIVRAVIATHPEFGAAMICKFIEDRFEPPVFISRSTVYRFLRQADLNTREKRQEYADQLFDPSVLADEI